MRYKNRYLIFEIISSQNLSEVLESDGVFMTELKTDLLE